MKGTKTGKGFFAGGCSGRRPVEESRKKPLLQDMEYDPVKIYLKEMSSVPLLTKAGEIEAPFKKQTAQGIYKPPVKWICKILLKNKIIFDGRSIIKKNLVSWGLNTFR